eukprot:CAMPEP_0185785296 /NCGR_PEP_ID=MMETSP1174-20130828/128806_1 /TAXON_ID=35687 /ORGANISM="Dictyocha speculum, Strain CCMP1381" /LENGTH=76 /DNA_ID=CAMNT_0028477305 /DNA_START=3 /DNA_END=230 /DNA_ORIENTATION=-
MNIRKDTVTGLARIFGINVAADWKVEGDVSWVETLPENEKLRFIPGLVVATAASKSSDFQLRIRALQLLDDYVIPM